MSTIFKNTVFSFSKLLDSPPVIESVALSAIPNNMLIKTMPNILFSTKAPNMLLGNILITVS